MRQWSLLKFWHKPWILNMSKNKNLSISPAMSLNIKLFHFMRDLRNRNLRILKLGSFKVVIPNRVMITRVTIVSSQFWYMILGTIGMILIIRFTALFMRFKTSICRTLNISQIIIASNEPNNSMGRIIFALLLVVYIVFASYIYSVISGNTLRSEPTISSLEDLANSSLTPMMEWIVKSTLLNSCDPHVRQLAEKSKRVSRRGPIV